MDSGKKITCLNCGRRFSADYAFCPYCGQANKKHDLSFKYVLSEFLSANFNLDSKIFVTLKLLLFSPGKLTRDYLDGKRMQYISPLRLYLFISLIYFFLLSVVPNRAGDKMVHVDASQKTAVTAKKEATVEIRTATVNPDTLNAFEKTILAKADRLQSEEGQKTFWQNMRKNISTGMLVLLPFTALLLYFLFYRNSYYFEHLIFIVHLQTVWFIISGVYMLIQLVFHWKALFYFELALLLWVTFLWFKQFYGKSTGKTIGKMILFFLAFGLLMILFFVIMAVISLLFL